VSVRAAATFLFLGATLAMPARASAEQSHLAIVVGLGGEPKYTEAFHELAVMMIGAAEKKLGVPAANLSYVGEKPAQPSVPAYKGRSTRENVQKALGTVARQAQPGDLVFILLMGHGSARSGESRFNLPGPDMTPSDFVPLLALLAAQEVVFVNTASASGEFVKALAGKGRTIVTATKSASEGNETTFPHYFVEAFADDKADADKDHRVSVAEAFAYARREVQRFYEKERRLLTEHAVLDDNGDGVGTAEPGPTGDGARAAMVFLGTSGDEGEGALSASDPRLAELRRGRRDLEQKIAALRARKPEMAAPQYEEELETLLLALARRDDAIRRHEVRK
jgi:hypothetical protein